ncbi:piggyBac transposable element-derived protein 1-like [Vespula maculifrons]|uniref:PiggyBac transposable element-derived protein 1-like n=1 Tax=Vespula maculifrons TaxID=7453 RepID=A0ABD2CF84_VESMC
MRNSINDLNIEDRDFYSSCVGYRCSELLQLFIYIVKTVSICYNRFSEKLNFPRQKNIDNIISSDSDSDVDKCNKELCTDMDIGQTLYEQTIKKDIEIDNAEENIIERNE